MEHKLVDPEVSPTPAEHQPGWFRKKPVVIEASQWFQNGDHPDDYSGVETFGQKWEGRVVRYFRRPDQSGSSLCTYCRRTFHDHGWIDTLEGGHIVCPGDWIITGVKGEHYPCKPDIFAATYEPVVAAPARAHQEEKMNEPHVEPCDVCEMGLGTHPWTSKQGKPLNVICNACLDNEVRYDPRGIRDPHPAAAPDAGNEKDCAEAPPMWPDAPLPPQLQAKVDAWLESNRGSGADFYHGAFPLGFVTRWIERAESAEGKLAAAGNQREKNAEALRLVVEALDPAAADTAPYGAWDAAKWTVFNAAVRFIRETPKLRCDTAADWPVNGLINSWKARRDQLWTYNRSPSGLEETERYARASELHSVIGEVANLPALPAHQERTEPLSVRHELFAANAALGSLIERLEHLAFNATGRMRKHVEEGDWPVMFSAEITRFTGYRERIALALRLAEHDARWKPEAAPARAAEWQPLTKEKEKDDQSRLVNLEISPDLQSSAATDAGGQDDSAEAATLNIPATMTALGHVEHVHDGDWIDPTPQEAHRLICCDCGLVHRVDFRVEDGRAQFRAFRDESETAEWREINVGAFTVAQELLAALKGLITPDGLGVYATSDVRAAGLAAIAKAEKLLPPCALTGSTESEK